jgi:hypothetical protein
MAKPNLTAQLLREYLHYDPSSGIFTWIKTPSKNKRFLQGKIAGKIDAEGYRIIVISSKWYRAARLAWLYVHWQWPKETIDHIDRNRSNDSIINLRDIPQRGQRQNQKCLCTSTTGLLGVHKAHPGAKSKPYQAYITINGTFKHLGMFKTPEEAHATYIAAKRELHPFGVL